MATTHHHDEAFDPGLWAHYAAALVGAWFFMSSLVWHDGMAVRSLDWILALLVIGPRSWRCATPGATGSSPAWAPSSSS